jgi:hypothetical protein
MRKIISLTILGVGILFIGLGIYTAIASNKANTPRQGLTLDLDLGNNDGGATPVVYDNSSTGVNATANDTQTCDNDGCTFDGSADYMSGTGTGVFNSANTTIAIKFTPDFDTDENLNRFMIDSSSGSRYIIYTRNNVANNTLDIWLGNTEIVTIAEATYSPYWNVSQENVLVVRSTTGNTDAWLNGNAILTDDNTAWSAANPANYYVGSTFSGTEPFDGTIHYLKVWNELLSDEEIADISDDREMNIKIAPEQGLTLNLDLGNNDGGGTPVVYDNSATGVNATAGNAQTCDNDGCTFDGTADYMSGTGTGVFNSANTTIAIKFTPDFDTDENAYRYLFDTTNGSRYRVIKTTNVGNNVLIITLGNTGITSIAEATYSPYWNVGEKNVLVIRGTTGNTDVWLNGNAILTDDNTAWSAANPANYYIGSSYNSVETFDGTIHYLKVWNELLSDEEIADISADREMKTYVASQNGLTVYFNMDNEDINGTTVYDRSGNGYDGTFSNSPTTGGVGKIKESVAFDGVDQDTAIPVGAWPGTSGSWCAWVNITDDTGNTRILATDHTGGGNSEHRTYQPTPSGQFSWFMAYGTGTEAAVLNPGPTQGEWEHICFTWEFSVDTVIKGYLQGVYDSDGDATITADSPETPDISIDLWSWSDANFSKGSIDDFRMYNRTLSAAEITNLYNASRQNYIK